MLSNVQDVMSVSGLQDNEVPQDNEEQPDQLGPLELLAWLVSPD